jgi:hypothetical protein
MYYRSISSHPATIKILPVPSGKGILDAGHKKWIG